MRQVVAVILLSLVATAVSLTGQQAFACSCIGVTVEEAFEQSDAVFVGMLSEIDRPNPLLPTSTDESRFIFDVTDVYKGAVYETQSVVTVSDGAACGLELPLGELALVFAREDDFDVKPVDGEYASTLCSGSRTVDRSDLPAELGSSSAPLGGSSPMGGGSSTLVRVGSVVIVSALALGAAALLARRRLGNQPPQASPAG